MDFINSINNNFFINFSFDIKKTISTSESDYKSYDKDKETQLASQIYLFPMIQLFCETKKGGKFEIYSIGSDKKFMIFSTF